MNDFNAKTGEWPTWLRRRYEATLIGEKTLANLLVKYTLENNLTRKSLMTRLSKNFVFFLISHNEHFINDNKLNNRQAVELVGEML